MTAPTGSPATGADRNGVTPRSAGTLHVDRDIGVPMRDGTVLATDVYRPPDDEPHPVVVQRTPYDKDFLLYTFATTIDLLRFVERGYAVVVQDCRGRFRSEGVWDPFRAEASDGYDTVEWIAAQEWCDGNVGAFGNSYIGSTALQAAVAAPPHLRAVFAYMAGPAYYRGWVYSGGVLELGFLYFWLLRGAWETLRRSDLEPARRAQLAETLRSAGSRPGRVIARLPAEELPGLAPELVPFWRDWIAHPGFDEYWRAVDVLENADSISVPVCHVTGLYDNFLEGHLALNERLKSHASPAVRDSHVFVLGPWDHNAYMTARPSAAGTVDFTPDAPNSYRLCHDLALRWFDRWLRGIEPDTPQPRARYFDTGTAAWVETEAWPPPATPVTFFLASEGRLVDDPDADGAPFDEFVYDPLDPVPTVGGRTLFPSLVEGGIQDQRAVEERADVLVYTSAALDRTLTVAGGVVVTLLASTDAEDTDFTAKLVDVEPDGFCRNLAEGIVRARYRRGADAPVFLGPGEVAELAIDLSAVAHTFGAGHRIRVEVSSSNFPRYDRNLNRRVDPARGGPEVAQRARQRVFHDATRRSRLELPVV